MDVASKLFLLDVARKLFLLDVAASCVIMLSNVLRVRGNLGICGNVTVVAVDWRVYL